MSAYYVSSEWWHGVAVGVPLLGIAAYLFSTDTLAEIRRNAADPKNNPVSAMTFARLSLCSLACFLIVPLADLTSAFYLPWYWVAGPAVLIGFKAGQWWEILQQIARIRARETSGPQAAQEKGAS